jgi:hypothetical protein
MHRRTRFALLALAVPLSLGLTALSCDATRETGPVAVSLKPLAIEVDATPLDVRLSDSYVNITTYDYTVLVVGASGPFTYRWYKRTCPGNVQDYDCTDIYSLLPDTGATVRITFPRFSSGTKGYVAVEVKQSSPDGSSGADSAAVKIPSLAGVYPTTNYDCALGTQGFQYPFQEWVYKPDSGYVTTPRVYRRNPCSGAKEFK